MEEIRWWARLLLISGVISVVLLISAPLGYRFGMTGLQSAFGSLALAVLGSAIVLLVSFVMVIITTRKGLVDNRQQLVIAALFSLLPLLAAVPQYFKVSSVPPINDISTDLEEPPAFDAALAERGEFSNDLNLEPAEAQQQKSAYPDVLPVTSTLTSEDAVSRSVALLEQMGLRSSTWILMPDELKPLPRLFGLASRMTLSCGSGGIMKVVVSTPARYPASVNLISALMRSA